MATDVQTRYHAAGNLFAAALRRLALCLKYAEDQPRVPAGNPDGGQWAGGGGAANDLDPFAGLTSSWPLFQLAGGFGKEDMGKTVQEFVAEKCKGNIYQVLPGQFLQSTIEDLISANKQRDRAAQRCYKLLRQERFRK